MEVEIERKEVKNSVQEPYLQVEKDAEVGDMENEE